MHNDLTIQIAGTLPVGLADELADDLGTYPQIESGSGRAIGAAAAEVVVSTVAATFFTSMAQQFGVQATERLCRGFGRLVKLARGAAPKHPAAGVMLIDEATGVRFMLSPSAVGDPKAMQALAQLDHRAYCGGVTLCWDPEIRRWTVDPRAGVGSITPHGLPSERSPRRARK